MYVQTLSLSYIQNSFLFLWTFCRLLKRAGGTHQGGLTCWFLIHLFHSRHFDFFCQQKKHRHLFSPTLYTAWGSSWGSKGWCFWRNITLNVAPVDDASEENMLQFASSKSSDISNVSYFISINMVQRDTTASELLYFTISSMSFVLGVMRYNAQYR